MSSAVPPPMPSPDAPQPPLAQSGRYVPPPPPPPLANPPTHGFPVAPPPAPAAETSRIPAETVRIPAPVPPSNPSPASKLRPVQAQQAKVAVRPPAPSQTQPKRTQNGTDAKSSNWRGEKSAKTSVSAKTPDTAADAEEPKIKRDFIAEAPPFLVSLVVHLVLLLTLGLLVRVAQHGPSSLMLSFGPEPGEGSDDLAMFNLEASPAMSDVQTESDATEAKVETKIDSMPLAKLELGPLTGPKEAATEASNGSVQVSASMPSGGMTSGRSGAGKGTLLSLFGGDGRTEDAVNLGLKWLAKYQSKTDGSWSLKGPYRDGSFVGRDNKTAATAMAMLAFLGSGHTHRTGDYQKQMDAAVRWLISQQDREGNLVKSAPRDQMLYAHAQATMALCELYGMTKDSSLRARAQLAIDYCIECQSREGGWRYEPRYDADTSVTGWFVMALMSGSAAGLDVPSSRLDKINGFLNTVQNDEGATYAYQPNERGSSPSMTAEGLLSRMYLGWEHNRPALQIGVGVLSQDFKFNYDDRNVYYWYYATQVMHHFGGSPWDEWNRRMKVELPAAQIKIGPEAGSWPSQGDVWVADAGRLVSTCLSIYCLEVYYRHMPLYKESSLRFSDNQPKKDPTVEVDPSKLKLKE